jgi:hypothetical protein
MKHRLSQYSIRLFKSRLVTIIVLLFLADLTAHLASASALNVPNPSFESPYVGLGGAQVAIAVWSINGTAGVAGNGWSGGQINLLNSDGDQIAWMNTEVNTSISQLLNETYSVGSSYQLTLGLARAAWNPPNDDDQIQIQFFYSAAGNPVIGSTTATGSELNPSNSNYLIDYTVDLPQVTASDIYAGMQIGIRIISSFEGIGGGSGDWVIDNVRLDEEQQTSPVDVANDSFETPDLSPDGAQAGIPDWNINGPAAGVAHNGWNGGQINLANSHGDQIGWMNAYADTANELASSGIWQLLADSYTAGQSYELTIGVARAVWNPTEDSDQLQIRLWYDAAGGPATIASVTITASDLNWSNGGDLIDYTVTLPEVLVTDAWAGRQIGVWIVASYNAPGGDGGDWVIDNVRLGKKQVSDTETPELSVVNADDPYIQYSGRINFANPLEPIFWWPGNYITAYFEGTSIKAKFNDLGNNYFAVIIDDNPEVVLDLGYGTGTYLLAGNLPDEVHKVVLFKRTETNISTGEGAVKFLGFELDNGKGLVVPPPRPYKRIEFYGDSITAGFGVDSTSNSGAAQYKNNYLDYGARTARMLNAEYHCQAISGVGIYKSWWQYPAGDNASMYEDYYFLETATTTWDFSKWIPQVVVINLGENDKNVGGVTQSQAEGYYRDFALALRGHYPDAHIIFALGSMSAADSATWKGYIDNVTNLLNGPAYNDEKVHRLFFDKINDTVNRHPVASEHLLMAQQLTDFIIDKVPWFGYEHGDMNGNGHVNLADFTSFSDIWLSDDCGFCNGGDLDGDADVDMDDLMTMNENWLQDIRLEGYWRFCGNVEDSSWLTRKTQSSGDPTFDLSGDNDGAIVLDGIDDFVEVSGYKGIPGGGQRTCAAWIKTIAVNGSILMWGDPLTNGGFWDFRLQDFGGYPGRLVVAVGGGYVASRQNLADGNWHHVTAVLENDGSPDANEIKLYIDGVQDINVDFSDEPIGTNLAQDVVIGFSTWYFQGQIDEVRIYNVALSEADILRLSQ